VQYDNSKEGKEYSRVYDLIHRSGLLDDLPQDVRTNMLSHVRTKVYSGVIIETPEILAKELIQKLNRPTYKEKYGMNRGSMMNNQPTKHRNIEEENRRQWQAINEATRQLNAKGIKEPFYTAAIGVQKHYDNMREYSILHSNLYVQILQAQAPIQHEPEYTQKWGSNSY
jgi:hypothetical protein